MSFQDELNEIRRKAGLPIKEGLEGLSDAYWYNVQDGFEAGQDEPHAETLEQHPEMFGLGQKELEDLQWDDGTNSLGYFTAYQNGWLRVYIDSDESVSFSGTPMLLRAAAGYILHLITDVDTGSYEVERVNFEVIPEPGKRTNADFFLPQQGNHMQRFLNTLK